MIEFRVWSFQTVGRLPYPAIVLSDDGIAMAREVGRQRTLTNKGHPTNLIDPNRPGVVVDMQGAIGEYAVSEYLGVPWTSRLWTRAEFEKRRLTYGDIEVVGYKNGQEIVTKVHIKSVDQPGHNLLVRTNERPTPGSICLLVMLDRLPCAAFPGWLFTEEVVRSELFDRSLPEPAWKARKSLLRSVDTLRGVLGI